LILGFTAEERIRFDEIASTLDFGDTVRVLPELSPPALALLYQGSTALFHPAPEPLWGGPIRHALACGKPVVASQHPQTSRMVGPAAYLAVEDDGRALGAALITVVVEEEVADRLAKAAHLRAAAWTGAAYSEALSVAYRKILEN
jgi:glycosyltransferase involved in cell wall biosynthesis